ncbi:hypothetical protein [Saccharothrix syringae]|uniref:Uncharacterized protein n=1 Tax=Saccharothrix syringae TaxID=103733 RepID=A0A5Q0H807_SACSY|nr:hypothetical protein [Saccharothrix syringae]QFZ22357.1 hypothetical protein EKG83_37480 [Saccharothrix syringae]
MPRTALGTALTALALVAAATPAHASGTAPTSPPDATQMSSTIQDATQMGDPGATQMVVVPDGSRG